MIQFSQDISEEKLLMAFNNNVIRFNSDSELQILNCSISGLGINAILYPKPDGSFFFNFKEYITAIINTKNFNDTIVTNLIAADVNTFTYDASDGFYINGNVLITINFIDASFETATRNLSFIAGVEQLETFKKGQIIIDNSDLVVLSPVSDRSNNKAYIKYWEGYPFEFSIYSNLLGDDIDIKNHSNALNFAFPSKGAITSLVLSDGRTDVTLEDFLPLVQGTNTLELRAEGGEELNPRPFLYVDKVDSGCGVYLKFLNKLGRWNYWLFSDRKFRTRSITNLASLNNDFENLEDTFSPLVLIGKESRDMIKLAAERINEQEMIIIQQIIESPKIQMFTGERFSKSSNMDWIDVFMKTNQVSIEEPKKKIYNFIFDIEIPNRYTQKL